MANLRLGNTYYIDTQYSTNEELARKNILVKGVVLTTSAAGGQLVLSDAGLGVKLSLKAAADEDTVHFDFSSTPVIFSTSIRPTTLSNAVATVIFAESGG